MSGIRRHGRGAGTGHPPLNGHGRRGHRPARAYAGRAARRTRKPSDPGPDVVERLLRKTIG